jgi:hypothetical protein
MHTNVQSKTLKGRDNLGDLKEEGRIGLKINKIFTKQVVRVWTKFIWLRTGCSGWLFPEL